MQETKETPEGAVPLNFVGDLEGLQSLDASVLDMLETLEALREDVKRNRVEFQFPDGLARVSLLDECRALDHLDDFDEMYALTMSMLEGKSLVIWIKNYDGTKTLLAKFQVVDKFMDLRGQLAIDMYPWLVNWLCEFMAAHISKKFPTPLESQPQAEESKTGGGQAGTRAGETRATS